MITVRESRRVGENVIPTNTAVEGIYYVLHITDAGELTGAALATANMGNITAMPSSVAITKFGAVYQLDSDGTWYKMG